MRIVPPPRGYRPQRQPDGLTLDLRAIAPSHTGNPDAILAAAEHRLEPDPGKRNFLRARVVRVILPAGLTQLPRGLEGLDRLRQVDIPQFEGKAIDLRHLGHGDGPLVRMNDAKHLARIDCLERQDLQVTHGHARKVMVLRHPGRGRSGPAACEKLPDAGYLREPRDPRLSLEQALQCLNGTVRFEGTAQRIVCRHIAVAFYQRRAAHMAGKQGLGADPPAATPARHFGDFFASAQALAAEVPAAIEQAYMQLVEGPLDAHQVSAERVNEFLCSQFQLLREHLVTGRQRVRHAWQPFLLLSYKHAMYLELQIKQTDDGTLRGSVLFYDPNSTRTYLRVALADPCRRAISLQQLIPDAGRRARYLGSPDDEPSLTAFECPGTWPAQPAPTEAPARPRRLHTRFGPKRLTRQEMQKRILSGLENGLGARLADAGLSPDERWDLVAGKSLEGIPWICLAARLGRAGIVRDLISQAMRLRIDPIEFLFPARTGTAQWPHVLAMNHGHTKCLRVLLDAGLELIKDPYFLYRFLQAGDGYSPPALFRLAGDTRVSEECVLLLGRKILQSTLSIPAKLQMLKVEGPQTTALVHAVRSGNAGWVRAMLKVLCEGPFTDAQRLELLNPGLHCLHLAMVRGRPEIVRDLAAAIRRWAPSPEVELRHLSAPDLGMSPLALAVRYGNTAAVQEWMEAALSINVGRDEKRRLLAGLGHRILPWQSALRELQDSRESVELSRIAWAQCIARAPASQLSRHDKLWLLNQVGKGYLLPAAPAGPAEAVEARPRF